jgi:hypothetical protein
VESSRHDEQAEEIKLPDGSIADQEKAVVVLVIGESARKANFQLYGYERQTNPLLSKQKGLKVYQANSCATYTTAGSKAILEPKNSDELYELNACLCTLHRLTENRRLAKENQVKIEESVEAVNMAGETFEEIFKNLYEAGEIIGEMIERVTKVDDIATSVAAISEEQSASTEEVTATTTDLASSAEAVAESSHGVDKSATTVSDSAGKIADFLNVFKF